VVVVRLPSLLAQQAGGQKQFDLEAKTVRDALTALPVADLLFDDWGELRPLVNVYLDGRDVRDREGLRTVLNGSEELCVVAAVAGGVA
jgi:molybdopterin converting factor small subunit